MSAERRFDRSAEGRGPRARSPSSTRFLLVCLLAVAAASSAGRIAFAIWAWPRISEASLPPASLWAKLLDLGLVGLIVLDRFVATAPPLARRMHRLLHGCGQAFHAAVQGILLLALSLFWIPWGGSGLSESVLLLWLARAAFLLGTFLYLLAAGAVGNDALCGFGGLRRVIQGRPPLPEWVRESVPSRGPFASSRNPMALALLVLLWAGGLFQRERLILAVGALLWILAAAWNEEDQLYRRNDPESRSWRKRTGFILPR